MSSRLGYIIRIMKEAESNSSSEAPTRTALRRYVVQRLLIKIIRGELGPGSRLIANGLAVQLGNERNAGARGDG